jgi:UDP-3-O-[3-hydroxymyristoyl] glucosamine N-acyltransferase
VRRADRSFPLGELAARLGAELAGDGGCAITGLGTLEDGGPGDIAFLANPRYRRHLSETRVSAVLLRQEDRDACRTGALVCKDPYLAYARVAALLYPEPTVAGGVHASAIVAPGATVDPTAWIGPAAVIEEQARIGPRAFFGRGCILGRGTVVGADCRLVARVTVCHDCVLGERCLVHPGAVIGSDGFGQANDGGRWVKVPQLGRVVVGDDVEVGANTTIDRGSLRDTVIGDGVRLDNLIQIAHNVEVGDHTAMAAFAGVSGSTRIGRHCTLAGASGLVGHISLADNVHVSGMTMVTHSITEPGVYSGNVPAIPNREWRKNIARFNHLDEIARRVRALEAGLAAVSGAARADDEQ